MCNMPYLQHPTTDQLNTVSQPMESFALNIQLQRFLYRRCRKLFLKGQYNPAPSRCSTNTIT